MAKNKYELNKWYKMQEDTALKMICLVKFNTVDAGNEFRLMINNGLANVWYKYETKQRVFADRVTEFMPIEFF